MKAKNMVKKKKKKERNLVQNYLQHTRIAVPYAL